MLRTPCSLLEKNVVITRLVVDRDKPKEWYWLDLGLKRIRDFGFESYVIRGYDDQSEGVMTNQRA